MSADKYDSIPRRPFHRRPDFAGRLREKRRERPVISRVPSRQLDVAIDPKSEVDAADRLKVPLIF